MVDYVFRNNASALLVSSITDTDNTLTLEAGKGALFPSPGVNEVATLTLFDALGNREIVTYTDLTDDTLSGVVRGTEGTVAQNWEVNTLISNRLTAAAIAEFLSRGATFEALVANGDVGTGADQVASGNHDHDSRYESMDSNIVRRNDGTVNFLGDVSIGGSPVVTENTFSSINYLETPEFAFPGNGTTSFTHSFGVAPAQMMLIMRCKESDHGFLVGEEMHLSNFSPRVFNLSSTPSHMYLRINNMSPQAVSAANGNEVTLNWFRWRLLIRAWK